MCPMTNDCTYIKNVTIVETRDNQKKIFFMMSSKAYDIQNPQKLPLAHPVENILRLLQYVYRSLGKYARMP